MAMYPCTKCLENDWSKEFIDGWIRATCNFCSYEVEFPTKKRKPVDLTKEPEPSPYTWEGNKRNGVEMILAKNRKGHIGYLTREQFDRKTGWIHYDEEFIERPTLL